MIKIPKQNNLDWYVKELADVIDFNDASINNMICSVFEGCQIKNISGENTNIKIKSLEDLVTSEFYVLKQLKKHIEKEAQTVREILNKKIKKNQKQALVKQKKESFVALKEFYNEADKFGEKFNNAYKQFSKENINNAIFNKVDIYVCPYCNREYINNRSYRHTQGQLDHFYDKGVYPIFALCFYNLIPSCYACNHIKSTREISVSPYDENYNQDNMKFEIADEEAIDGYSKVREIKLKYDKEKITNVEILKLENIYQLHKDYVQEIKCKRYAYSDSSIDFINKTFGEKLDLIENKEELYSRMLYGNYIELDNLSKRPLSKLTRDILSQLNSVEY